MDSTGDTHSELTGTAAVAERISAALQPFAELAGRPTAELRALGTNEEVGAGDLRDASVFQAVNTVELLGNLDPAEFDAAALVQWADGIEQVRRMAEAAAVAVAEHVDRTAPFREQGLFSARTWLRNRLQLSGAEALARVPTARMHRQLPGWAEAEHVGALSDHRFGIVVARREDRSPHLGWMLVMDDQPRPRNNWYLGVLIPLVAAVVWVVLAVRTPSSTFHFAPLVVAVAWAVFGRIGDDKQLTGRENLIVGASGGVIAAVTGLALQAAGKLDGPTFWSDDGAIVEVLIFAAAGTLYGLRGLLPARSAAR